MTSQINNQSGLSILEVIITVAIASILAGIAFPEIGNFNDSISVTRNNQAVMLKIAHVRAEAIRSKQAIRISFTQNSLNWDIGDDNSNDGTYLLQDNVSFSGSLNEIVFDGFGFAKEIGNETSISIVKNSNSQTIKINANGHIEKE